MSSYGGGGSKGGGYGGGGGMSGYASAPVEVATQINHDDYGGRSSSYFRRA
jgi:hypothetical protein